jgi:hypothetical protein
MKRHPLISGNANFSLQETKMTTEHTDHTEHTEHKGSEESTQQTRQEQQTDSIETTIIFNGLMVFRPDQLNKVCELGVLLARDHGQPHILQIEIEPDPRTGTGSWTLDSDLLWQYVQGGNIRWKFEVVRNGQPVPPGIVVDPAIPLNRHTPPSQGPIGFGWMVNLECGEFHSNTLTRTAGKLKPIIQLTTGQLFTRCLTDSIDVKHGSNTRLDFGFIAGAAGLKLTPADGDMAILYFIDQQQRPTEIFRLPDINRVSYKVFIRNTPTSGSAGGHFHLFYDRLFQSIGGNQRFDLQMHYPPIPVGAAATCSGIDAVPDPFKCGGVLVGGDRPLE